MDGLVLLEPMTLYNMLQQATVYSCLSDPNYLLLIDARKKHEYNESHVVTAKKAPKVIREECLCQRQFVDELYSATDPFEVKLPRKFIGPYEFDDEMWMDTEDDESSEEQFVVPYDAELECKQNIVVYDSKTSSLSESSDAIECGKLLWESGSRNKVKVLKGGYEEFSALYPFLRTQKIMFMPRELDDLKAYPTEIIPGFLYLGNWRQGNAPYVQKDLKIKAHVNCCVEAETFFPEPGPQLLHIQVQDTPEGDLYGRFKLLCRFVNDHRELKMNVLIFSNLGISRSATMVMAYLMHNRKWTLQEAYDYVKKCNQAVRPMRNFIQQLSKWEKDIHEKEITDISDPNF